MVTASAPSRSRELLTPDFMRQLDRLDLLSRRILRGRLQGERRSKKRGQGVEFSDYRPYAPGDDLRFIDWNLYARLERLFLRLFMEEEDLTLSVVFDVTRSMDYGDPGKLDFARRLAAALAYLGLVHHNRVTLACLADDLVAHLPGLRGRQPIPRMLDFLEKAQPADRPGDLGRALRRFALAHRHKGLVILVSDFLDKGDLSAALRYLAGDQHEVFVVHVLSPQEVDPVKAGLAGDLRLRDSEDAQTSEVSINAALLKRYRSGLQRFCDDVRDQCVRRDMAYLFTDTTTPLEDLILKHLRQRGLVG